LDSGQTRLARLPVWHAAAPPIFLKLNPLSLFADLLNQRSHELMIDEFFLVGFERNQFIASGLGESDLQQDVEKMRAVLGDSETASFVRGYGIGSISTSGLQPA
jgi:hypothetical protein